LRWSAIAKLDKYRLLILGDLAYVTTDQPETSVLFELTSAGYGRHLGDAPTRLG
jgi:DNA replication protein DnaC